MVENPSGLILVLVHKACDKLLHLQNQRQIRRYSTESCSVNSMAGLTVDQQGDYPVFSTDAGGSNRSRGKPVDGLKYFCSGVVLLNVVYAVALFFSSPGFVLILKEYQVFFVVYFLSMISAALGIYDNRDLLFYPVLITTLPLAFMALSISVFQMSQGYFCVFTRHAHGSNIDYHDENIHKLGYHEIYDCSFLPPTANGWSAMQLSITTAVVFLFLAVEKLVECFFFRKLQKKIFVKRKNKNLAALQPARLADILEEINVVDSDDDMIIYDHNGKNYRVHEHSGTANPFEAVKGPSSCRTIA